MDCWYFAYGSNLWREQMTKRTGAIRTGDESPRIAQLANHRVAFNMNGRDGNVYANIIQPGAGVIGVIYRCDEEVLRKLDVFEEGYDRAAVTVVDANGNELPAVTYISKPDRITPERPPSDEYVTRYTNGFRDWNLPADYVRAIHQLSRG